jgi:hypothetical protein
MATYAVTVNPFGSFSGNVTLGVTGLPGGVTPSFAANPVAVGKSTTMTIDTTGLGVGTYNLQVAGTG